MEEQNNNNLNEVLQNQLKVNNKEQYIIEQKIKLLWGKNYEENVLLVKRAVAWLELEKEPTDNNGEEEVAILLKLLQLGKLITEDNNSFNNNTGVLTITKNQAILERNKLTNNKEFMNLINNKSKIGHFQALEQLNYLNNIIATNN